MRYTIAERAYGKLRYVYRRYRETARDRFYMERCRRRCEALKRAKLWHRLLDAPLSTSHENHCCRDKPRHLLDQRRPKRPNLARDRAEAHWALPF